MKLELQGFLGANLFDDEQNIPDGQVAFCSNQKPRTNGLTPWCQPTEFDELSALNITPNSENMIRFSPEGLWAHESFSLVKGKNFKAASLNKTKKLIYLSNDAGQISEILQNRRVGIFRPEMAPVFHEDETLLAPAASETFSYVFTLVNELGQESMPSPPSADHTINSGFIGTVSFAYAIPPGGNWAPITKARLYRTWVTPDGRAEYFRVTTNGVLYEINTPTPGAYQFPVSSGNAPGEVLETSDWEPLPEEGAHHVVTLWNDMYAVLIGNTVRISETGVFYAYPLKYEITLESETVACAVYAQNLVVVTKGRPHIITGSTPADMNSIPLDFHQACIQPDTCMSIGHGVVWAGPDGLAYTGIYGSKILTNRLVEGARWREEMINAGNLDPWRWQAAFYDGLVFLCCRDQSIPNSMVSPTPFNRGFFIDPLEQTGIFFIDWPVISCVTDAKTGKLLIYDKVQKKIQDWHGAAPSGEKMTAFVRSKRFKAPHPVAFSRAKAICHDDVSLGIFSSVGGDMLQIYLGVFEADVIDTVSEMSMSQDYQIEVRATNWVKCVSLAESIEDYRDG